jgi:hypothetical protein
VPIGSPDWDGGAAVVFVKRGRWGVDSPDVVIYSGRFGGDSCSRK